MSNGLSGRPFDTCDQVKNERNAFALDLRVGLLLSSPNQADIIYEVICEGPTQVTRTNREVKYHECSIVRAVSLCTRISTIR